MHGKWWKNAHFYILKASHYSRAIKHYGALIFAETSGSGLWNFDSVLKSSTHVPCAIHSIYNALILPPPLSASCLVAAGDLSAQRNRY